jgi:predicted HD phosphohydrolase
MTVIDRIFHLFAVAGQGAYFGEAVSQMEHALQAAHLAESSGAADALVVAALLHDVGHLLHGLGEDAAERGIARHERGGADWLARHFVPAVVAPVRLHVDAKRYLCAADPDYLASLSPASVGARLSTGAARDARDRPRAPPARPRRLGAQLRHDMARRPADGAAVRAGAAQP